MASIYDGPQYARINRDFPGLSNVCLEPPIYLASTFLTAAQCEGVIAAARGHLVASAVHNGTEDSPRTSSSMELSGEWARLVFEQVRFQRTACLAQSDS